MLIFGFLDDFDSKDCWGGCSLDAFNPMTKEVEFFKILSNHQKLTSQKLNLKFRMDHG